MSTGRGAVLQGVSDTRASRWSGPSLHRPPSRTWSHVRHIIRPLNRRPVSSARTGFLPQRGDAVQDKGGPAHGWRRGDDDLNRKHTPGKGQRRDKSRPFPQQTPARKRTAWTCSTRAQARQFADANLAIRGSPPEQQSVWTSLGLTQPTLRTASTYAGQRAETPKGVNPRLHFSATGVHRLLIRRSSVQHGPLREGQSKRPSRPA